MALYWSKKRDIEWKPAVILNKKVIVSITFNATNKTTFKNNLSI